jgi:hypothetical protein
VKAVIASVVFVLAVVVGVYLYTTRPPAYVSVPQAQEEVTQVPKRPARMPLGSVQPAREPLGVGQPVPPIVENDESAEPLRHAEKADPALRDAIPGEYIMSFFNAADLEAFLEAVGREGAHVLGRFPQGHTIRLRVGSRDQLERILATAPAPVSQSRNYIMREPPPVTGTDPRSPDRPYYGFGGSVVAWLGTNPNTAGRGEGVMVSVLDSGVSAHPTLEGAAITTVDLETSGNTIDTTHGTAVASLIVGRSQNVPGLAPESEILSIDVMSGDGVGDLFTLAAGIVEATDRGSAVINISLGSHGQSYVLENAIAYAIEHGAVVVAAAGNDAMRGVLYPAAYDSVIAVAAVDRAGQHLYFSNRGTEIDIAAPGILIDAAGENGSVAPFSGTSAAAPLVSAAIAGLLSADPTLSAREAADILLAYADDYGAPGVDEEYGHGILNLNRVENRDVPGLYDAAIGPPSLLADGASQDLIVYVQNRGTEPLNQVDVEMTINGVPATIAFYNVAAGATASRAYPLDMQNLVRYGEISVSLKSSIPGQEDMLPANDAVTATVTLQSTP